MLTLFAWIALATIVVTVAVIAFLLVRKPINDLLGSNAALAPIRRFYLRSLGLVLTYAALACGVGASLPSSEQRQSWQPMEAIWWAANSSQPALWAAIVFLLIYVVLLSVLHMVMGRKHD